MSNDPSRPGSLSRAAHPRRRGVCLVLAAAPGGGKTSISRALLAEEKELALSISATTRAPRPGEREGVHYFFRTPEQFAAGVAAGEFLEHATFLGRSYGTPRAPVDAALAAGRDVLFDIEWQGHRLLKAAMPEDVVGVFLLPPSLAELERRLRGRGQDDDAEITRRLAVAREEMRHWDEFEHVLVNDDFATTVAAVRAILHAARTRRSRQPWMGEFVAGLVQG
ncbi:guanylate kinase [Siccirubricoccus sp. KC 17139]|uniref:Guanylate kinase n=1 Tax=Siccirubricoccus soli TaxID=2899147 RepID=A0ABT1D0G7_9PROT|nr:guanylate kinase [Siccirubricoccus soli]MCO6415384.1 guanylate kinase [Siccirubricoccus soli]MCP2681516.1 guanylate kinase [Siccirubricoccus soli]